MKIKSLLTGLVLTSLLVGPAIVASSVDSQNETAFLRLRFNCSWVNGVPSCRFVG